MDNNFTEIYEVSEPDYKTTLYKKILPVPCVLWVVCIAAAIAVGYTVENAILRDVLIVVLALTVLISAAVLLFVVMPKLRIKQARLDIKNYDFKPYVDESAEETFYGEIAVQVETFDLTTTVDENEKLTFKAWYQAEHYLKNFAAENRLTKVVHLAPYDGFIPFYTFGINEAKFVIYKEADENQTILTVAEQHEITFTDDGLKIGGLLIGYKRIIATAEASFTFNTYARIMLDCGNGIGASFAINPEIVAVLDKFNVTINDRLIADFILANPSLAFDKIAVLSTAKRIKRYIRKNKNG